MPEREDTEPLRQSDLPPVEPDASDDTVEIVAAEGDHRSGIVDQLKARDDLVVRIEPIDVADYMLSKRVAVNRIRLHPSHNLTDEGVQALVDQLRAIAEVCSRPVLVLEREHTAAETASPVFHEVRARLATEYLNLLESGSATQTAELLAMIARREQTSTSKSRSPHQGGQARTLAEQQEYVVASITDLGPVTARTLLEHFTSVEGVVSASEEELLEVAGIGEELAARVREVVSSRYIGPPR